MAVATTTAQVVATLDDRFTRLSEADAADQDIMFGVLQAVMSGLPQPIAVQKYFEKMLDSGFCFRVVLEELTVQDLADMGMPRGHAIAVFKILFPKPHVAVRALQPSQQTNNRSVAAPAFPMLGRAGLPSARSLKAWMPAVFDVLKERGVPSLELKAVLADSKEDIDPAWVHGGLEDQVLWSVLVRCGKEGIPADLMLSFPASVRDGEQGLRAWQHLFQRVLVVTDQSISALQARFDSPPVVRK